MSTHFAEMVGALVNKTNANELLDYGAGKGRLGQSIAQHLDHNVTLTNYDPGMPGIDESPEPHEFVACIDVLEHIEPDLVDNVLDDLKRVTKEFGFFTISCVPAKRILSDGRNAHLIVEPPWYWLPKVAERFEVLQFQGNANHFFVFVRALPEPDKP